MKARASAPSSANCFFTTKETDTSLRWYMFLRQIKRFILGRRVRVFTSAAAITWKIV